MVADVGARAGLLVLHFYDLEFLHEDKTIRSDRFIAVREGLDEKDWRRQFFLDAAKWNKEIELIPSPPESMKLRIVPYFLAAPARRSVSSTVQVTVVGVARDYAVVFRDPDRQREYTRHPDAIMIRAEDRPSEITVHECGHILGNVDEYHESEPRYKLPGFRTPLPGLPFARDRWSMMVDQDLGKTRLRHYWHFCEWASWLLQHDLRILNAQRAPGTRLFDLPHHPNAPHRSYAAFPVAEAKNQSIGPEGRFDVFLYATGQEPFRDPPVKLATDGVLSIVVGLNLVLDHHLCRSKARDRCKGHKAAKVMDATVERCFNRRFVARGTTAGVLFNRVLLDFRVLFKVSASAQDDIDPQAHHRIVTKYAGRSTWGHDPSLSLRIDNELGRRFRSWFCDMIGIDRLSFASPDAYLPLVRTVLPDGEVEVI